MRAVLLIVGLALSGCVPEPIWDNVTLNQQSVGSNSLDKVKVGDIVRAHYKEGSTHAFRVVELEPEAFIGNAKDGKRYRVRYDALLQLEIRRTDLVAVRLPNIPLAGGIHP